MLRALVALLLAACAAPAAPSSEYPSPTSEGAEARAAHGSAGAGGSGAGMLPTDNPTPPPAEGPPPGARSLPAVTVRNIGLHVGGGPNDSASKAPYLRAIERQFSEFLRCYALIGEPGAGGTFGVDLHIGARGGNPSVEQPRTGLEGEDFRTCMLAAFANVDFEPPPKPIVISYSLRFAVDG